MKRIAILLRQIFVILFAVLATWFTFYNILKDPAHVVHELGGDGMKNYFSLLYHTMYGSGWWFDGMNYPYGEHIMFVDGLPILSITLAYLRSYIDLTPEIVNVVLNLSMAFAYFLAIVYVYRILLKFGVKYYISLLFAAIIVAMSMQNFMVYGLYGLSYAFVVPMTFYWFICYKESGRYKHLVYVLLLSIVSMLLHPYLLALILIWSSFYVVGYLLFVSATKRIKSKHVLPVILLMVCTISFFKAISVFTDPITDRPNHPHGLLNYCTTGANLITQQYSPYTEFLNNKGILSDLPTYGISYSYMGLVALTIIIFAILVVFIQRARRKGNAYGEILLQTFSPVWLFIGVSALLFSMGVPFVWGLDFLYDYTSYLRQFRSLNYFGLLFYYVATITAVLVANNILIKYQAKSKMRSVGYVGMLIILSIWGYEAYGMIINLHKKGQLAQSNYEFFYSQNEKSWNELLEECNYMPTDFQAILHLSYHHVGSEKIWLFQSAWGLCLSMKAAFQLKLPLVDANMSRSSWQQTFKQVKISGGPYTYKHLINEASDNRPFLILIFEYDKLNPDEQYVIDHASFLGRVSNTMTYVLYPEDLKEYDERLQQRAKTIASYKQLGDTSLCDGDIYYNHYDNSMNRNLIFGKGAANPVIDKDTSFEVIDISTWDKEPLYEISAWVLVNDINYHAPNTMVSLFDTNGTELAKHDIPASKSTDIQGLWFRPSLFLNLPKSTSTLVLSTREYGKEAYYGLDEVLIRQATDTIISIDDKGRIMVNNHLLK